MKLYEVAYSRLEARRRDELTRELFAEGWEVWTDFRYELGPNESVLFDLLARKDGVIRVVEIVKAAGGKNTQSKLERLRGIAESNGWEFVLDEVRDPTGRGRSEPRHLAGHRAQLKALMAAYGKQSDAVVRGAVSTQAIVLAWQLVSEYLAPTSPQGANPSALDAARRLVDSNRISDETFERVVRLRNLRNKLTHGLAASVDEAALRDAISLANELRSVAKE